jgi:Heterokaryon incompatibility protein (HET)
MRLLHTQTLELGEFLENATPDYAILSHTWEQEEVTYQDMQGLNVEEKAGYTKIQHCCQQAARDGYEYVWIDTCCINKSSSAELSEAINSMYVW